MIVAQPTQAGSIHQLSTKNGVRGVGTSLTAAISVSPSLTVLFIDAAYLTRRALLQGTPNGISAADAGHDLAQASLGVEQGRARLGPGAPHGGHCWAASG
jgi:hypothetical protein